MGDVDRPHFYLLSTATVLNRVWGQRKEMDLGSRGEVEVSREWALNVNVRDGWCDVAHTPEEMPGMLRVLAAEDC